MRKHWRQFVGLPHRTGANPATDEAADCLLVAFAVLDELGLPHPAPDPVWFRLAATGAWGQIHDLFEGLTEPCVAGDGAVALHVGGVSIVVDGGVLLTRHRDGVRWVPLELIGIRQWRRFK